MGCTQTTTTAEQAPPSAPPSRPKKIKGKSRKGLPRSGTDVHEFWNPLGGTTPDAAADGERDDPVQNALQKLRSRSSIAAEKGKRLGAPRKRKTVVTLSVEQLAFVQSYRSLTSPPSVISAEELDRMHRHTRSVLGSRTSPSSSSNSQSCKLILPDEEQHAPQVPSPKERLPC